MIFDMSAFSLLIGLGATLGLWQVARSAPLNQAGRWVDSALGVLVGMLLGARLGYVGLHPAYYAAHPWEWAQLWMGGFALWGAVAGGLLAAVVVAVLLERSMLRVLDTVAPLFPPLAVLGWLGCYTAGCAYGPALAPGAWLGLPAVDESGQVLSRFPLQIFAALVLLGYNWAVMALLPRRSRPGQYAALVGLGLAAVMFCVAALSAEPAPFWGSFTPDAWAALAIGGLSVMMLVIGFLVRKR
jgi:phosphatidylglycerol---prolipoprotein diacylglyceryl transferase